MRQAGAVYGGKAVSFPAEPENDGGMDMPQTIAIETVKTDAFSMEYFRFGQGRDTLVILPGISVQSVMGAAPAVAQAYRPLTDDFTIYVFDRRRELPASYTVREMARDTARAFEALGLRQVCLFGASQGGMMALCMAIEFPALVRKLVVGSTAARMTPDRWRVFEEWIRLAQKRDARALYQAFGEAVYPQGVYQQIRDDLLNAARSVTDGEMERFITLARGMRDFDVAGDLGGIRCPALVIGAADDRVFGADAAAQIAKGIPCPSYVYDGCGHAAYDTAADYKERLQRFFVEGDETRRA
jgi:3-oxoadipate enol-lactonase